MFIKRISIASVMVALAALPAHAAYMITPMSAGSNARSVNWGEAFTLDLVITSNASDSHTSAIVQTRFTRSGLVLESYSWGAPYQTGGVFDDSIPAMSQLPMPLTAGILSGPGYPLNLVDIEFSNVLIGSSFGQGTLVSMQLRVPANYGFIGSVFISLNPDQFFSGFSEVPTAAGQVFTLNIVPAPATAVLAAMVCIAGAGGGTLRRRYGR